MNLFSIIYDFFYQLFSGIGKGDYSLKLFNTAVEEGEDVVLDESIDALGIKINGYDVGELAEFNYMSLPSWLSLISTLIIAALLIFVAIKFIVWCFRIVGSLIALKGN